MADTRKLFGRGSNVGELLNVSHYILRKTSASRFLHEDVVLSKHLWKQDQ